MTLEAEHGKTQGASCGFILVVLLLCALVITNGWRIMEERESAYVCESR